MANLSWRRRQSSDFDWEAELAARQPSAAVASPPKPFWTRVREPVARLPRRVRWTLNILASALDSAGSLDLVFHDSKARGVALGMIITGLALGFLVWPFKRTDAAALATESAHKSATRGTDLLRLFYVMSHEATQFRVRPPHAGNYDYWLTSATEEVARYSPSLAAEWERPELKRGPLLDPPPPEAILERLNRITEMYNRIDKNGISLEELAAAGFPGASEALSTSAAAA
jgi:hypothetical protein